MDFEFKNKPDDFREQAAAVIKRACLAGADAAEAGISESVDFEVSVRRSALDNMEISREQGLSLTVYLGGGSGNVSIGDLGDAAVEEAVRRAMEIASASAPDPYAGLAEVGQLATDIPDLDLYELWDITVDDAILLAKRCEEASWAAHVAVSREKSDGASVSSAATLSVYANSHGFNAATKTTAHSISCAALAEEGDEMECDSWSETCRHPGELPAAETIGGIAGNYAARRLGGGIIDDAEAGVLFQAPASHSLIRHFIGAASGGALYRKTSWLNGQLESGVFAPHMTIREEPHIPGGLRSAAYDADGVVTRQRDVVADGVWKGCFLSAYSARRLGMASTGNAGGAHNLEVYADTAPEAELLKMMERGLLVTDLMGQGVNPVTGDYSRGAAGFWVEDGEIAYPVSKVTVAGNLRQMLASITRMGDEPMRRGLVKCGALLVPDLMIGGNK